MSKEEELIINNLEIKLCLLEEKKGIYVFFENRKNRVKNGIYSVFESLSNEYNNAICTLNKLT